MPILNKEDKFWETKPGNKDCRVVDNSWELCRENLTKKIILEFTLALRDDSKENLLKHYKKILNAINQHYRIDSTLSYFEMGGLHQHRHIHASICVTLPNVEGFNAGLIQELSYVICTVIRRKYSEKCFFPQYERYHSIPFVLQINNRDTWGAYIAKDARAFSNRIIL